VPDEFGNLPVIDGDGAITPTYLDYWNEPRNLIKIGGASTPGGGPPSHVRVEGLKIQNARLGLSFIGDNGASGWYVKNAACIMIEAGFNIELVGNEITGCGNGIFVSPNQSGDILVERNYIHGNGADNSFYEHNVYTETLGITYQYNRFGPLCSTCLGNNLKDRSAGLIVAYNFIEGGNRQLDIVDSSNYDTQANYDDTYIYGNILIETDVNNGNRQMIHYGGDGGDTTKYREGTLHFYHNTLLSTRTGKTTLVRLSSDTVTMDARNNIIYVTDTNNNLELLAEKRGSLLLRNNWLRPGYFDWVEATYGGSITEVGTVLEDSTPIFDDASFDSDPYDLHLAASLLFGTTIDPSAPPVTSEYVMHVASQSRSANDLGAYGYGAGPVTPGPTANPTTPSPTTKSPTNSPTGNPTTSSPTTKSPTNNPTKLPTNVPTPTPQPVTKYICHKNPQLPSKICENGVSECSSATCSNGGKQCWEAQCPGGTCSSNGSACGTSSECCSGYCSGVVCEDEPAPPTPGPACAAAGESCRNVDCCDGLTCPNGAPSSRFCE